MPAKYFQCADGGVTQIAECLKSCRMKQRCLFLPTLSAISKSVADRKIEGFTITELLSGTLEQYLKRTTNYSVDPMAHLYAIQGSAAHLLHQGEAQGMLSEERLYDKNFSGAIDLYGAILDENSAVLGDLKISSSYKIMRCRGRYAVSIPSPDNEVYKSGPKRGQVKTVKVWRDDGVKHCLEYGLQLNSYRLLLQQAGYPVERMVVELLCRDYGLQIASSRGIDQPVYLLDIKPISDRWLRLYLETKAKRLRDALDNNVLPQPCNARERWHDRKCTGYCEVSSFCPHAQSLKKTTGEVA